MCAARLPSELLPVFWTGAPFPLHRANMDAVMKYGITIATIGEWPFIEVSRDEFHQIKTARSNLLMILDIEEKFELLAENYAEYESSILGIVQRRMVRGDGTWTTAMDDLLLINRRLTNVLMAGRLYEDHAKHAISTLYGSDALAHVCAVFSQQYDQALGFRAMAALRNYSQHQALPVATIQYSSERTSRGGQHLIQFALRPQLNLAALRASDFKRSVLVELETDADGPNVTALLRDFVTGFGCAHHAIRELTKEDSGEWKRRIKDVLNIGREQVRQVLGLAAVARDDDGNHPEIVEVFEDMVSRLDALQVRYANVGFLKNWFVSGEGV